MAAIARAPAGSLRRTLAEAAGWAQENIWPTLGRGLAHLALLLVAVWVVRGALVNQPVLALGVVGLWLAGLVWVVIGAVRHHYDLGAQWLKDRLFNSAASAMVTLIIALWIVAAIRGLLAWAFLDASFVADPAAVGPHTGATWGVVIANLKLFLVGQFPRGELWRVWASALIVVALIILFILVYGPLRQRLGGLRRVVVGLWLVSPIVLGFLLRGISPGTPLPIIETRFWGGLLLTLIITVFAVIVSFPLGILLALGRRSQLPGVPAWLIYLVAGGAALWGLVTYTLPAWPLARSPLEFVIILWPVWLLLAGVALHRVWRGNVAAAFSTLYIELVRGVPLITVLFLAQLMLPLFLPANLNIENAYRVMWGFALFSAAYLAENVRGALQSIPKGQYEAAEALGLNTFNQLRLVILPQALRVVIPPITGQFIALFKDTTLVAIVGLFDLLNIANAVIAQPDWLGLRREAYLFITVIYYIGCYGRAQMGYWLERQAGLGKR